MVLNWDDFTPLEYLATFGDIFDGQNWDGVLFLPSGSGREARDAAKHLLIHKTMLLSIPTPASKEGIL